MIRIRGLPISDEDAAEIALRLRRHPADIERAERIEQAVDSGGGLIGATKSEARAILRAIAGITDDGPDAADRLDELITALHEYVSSAA